MRRTSLWAARQRRAPRARGQLLFGIAQGASDPDLRRRSIDEIVALDLTWSGRLNLRNARFARDAGRLDEDCSCPACARFSRPYLRHLVNQQELLGLRLLSLHNLRFVLELTAGARAAIERGELAAFKAQALARLAGALEEAAWSC